MAMAMVRRVYGHVAPDFISPALHEEISKFNYLALATLSTGVVFMDDLNHGLIRKIESDAEKVKNIEAVQQKYEQKIIELQGELQEKENEIKEKDEKCTSLLSELGKAKEGKKRLHAEETVLRKRVADLEFECAGAKISLSEERRRVVELESDLAQAMARAKIAEDDATDLRKSSWDSEEKARQARERAEIVEEQNSELRKELQEAILSRNRSVKETIESPEFESTLADYCASSFVQGFKRCREVVQNTFPDIDIGLVVLSDSEDIPIPTIEGEYSTPQLEEEDDQEEEEQITEDIENIINLVEESLSQAPGPSTSTPEATEESTLPVGDTSTISDPDQSKAVVVAPQSEEPVPRTE